MIQRLCVATVLASLAGCGSSGDGSAAPEPIRIPALGVAADAAPGDAITVPEVGGTAGEAPARAPVEASPPSDDLPSATDEAPPALAVDGTPLPGEVDERLRGVFEIANGDAVEFAVAVARRLVDVEVGPREGFTLSRRGADPMTRVEDTTLLCPEGGTLDTTSSSLLSSDGVYTLRECDVGPLVLSGTIRGRVRGPGREIEGEVAVEPDYAFEDLVVVDSRTGRTIAIASGKVIPTGIDTAPAVRFGYGSINTYGSDRTVGAGSMFDERRDRTLAALGTMGTRTRSNPTVEFPLGGMTTSFDVRFGTAPARAEVRTVAPFAGLDPQGRFARGSLTVVDEEGGYVYTLDAENGDPATFRLDVVENAVTTSYTVSWSSAFGFDAFEPERIDVGF